MYIHHKNTLKVMKNVIFYTFFLEHDWPNVTQLDIVSWTHDAFRSDDCINILTQRMPKLKHLTLVVSNSEPPIITNFKHLTDVVHGERNDLVVYQTLYEFC